MAKHEHRTPRSQITSSFVDSISCTFDAVFHDELFVVFKCVILIEIRKNTERNTNTIVYLLRKELIHTELNELNDYLFLMENN